MVDCNEELWNSTNAGLCGPDNAKDLLTLPKVSDQLGGWKHHWGEIVKTVDNIH